MKKLTKYAVIAIVFTLLGMLLSDSKVAEVARTAPPNQRKPPPLKWWLTPPMHKPAQWYWRKTQG